MFRKRYPYRCSDGHLFSHSYWWWFYGGAFTVVRLGFAGYMHCPVGNHWGLVRRANERDLTEQERETLEARASLDDRDGVKFSASLYLLAGVAGIVHGLIDHDRWEILLTAVWVAVGVPLFIRAFRPARS